MRPRTRSSGAGGRYQHTGTGGDGRSAGSRSWSLNVTSVRAIDDNDQATALMDVLDIFVAVGWPKARRLVYGLDELYR